MARFINSSIRRAKIGECQAIGGLSGEHVASPPMVTSPFQADATKAQTAPIVDMVPAEIMQPCEFSAFP
jgi:hypothetical protein